MDVQTRYTSKSECFEQTVQKALGSPDEVLVDFLRERLGQVPVPAKDRPEWEYVIRANIWDHVAKEGDLTASSETRDTYFKELFAKLDVAIEYTELEACGWQFVLEVLEEVLDGHTIDSCTTIFGWVEDRSSRLLKGMVPSKGKALVVLRTLNALKARAARTGFAGRILAFQSGIFDITERSGVNLQGELGSTWNGVAIPPPVVTKSEAAEHVAKQDGGDAMEGVESTDKPTTGDDDKKTAVENKASADGKPTTDAKTTPRTPDPKVDPTEQRRNLYNTFWQLQLFFANPLVFAEGISAQAAAANGLFSDTEKPTDLKPADVLSAFKKAVDTVIPVLSERTRKDKALMGRESKGSGSPVVGVKRKRTVSSGVRRVRDQMEDENARELELEQQPPEDLDLDKYFFAKFLTSPDLLDLELADTNFRRQILFQLMIMLKHLSLAIQYAKPTLAPASPSPASAPQQPINAPPMLVPNAKSLAVKQQPPTPSPSPVPPAAAASVPPPLTPAALAAQQRRKRLMGDITVSAEDEQWVRRLMSSCLDEWRATGAGSVKELFIREEHWVEWKNAMCSPFERRGLNERNYTEEARKTREEMIIRPLDVWRNPLGSASLTAVWDSKYNGSEDLEDVLRPPSMQKFENLNKSINLQIQRAEAAIAAENASKNPPPVQPSPVPPQPTDASSTLAPPKTEGDTGTPGPATPKPIAKPLGALGVPPKPNIPSRAGTPVPMAQPQTSVVARPSDEELPRAPKPAPRLSPKQMLLEDHQLTKTKICWQALRAASLLGHTRVFGQIGLGSVDLLIQEIEKDKKKYEDDRAKRLAVKADESAKAAAASAASEETKPLIEADKVEAETAEAEKGEDEKVEPVKAETMEVDA
ncbi:THO complex subunit 1 transcription elongation factor [Rhizoctonia solani 123E]|uniref:THO complex subunit 1 transcription elongation factor n=1 Tax=Rhizoctonia solani 123E TaxID=1423351 RepID=A0A074S608_9AGAM|nr:THO complex subunit 1 transcription elongation factor [Rhizoctonia solani 123E]